VAEQSPSPEGRRYPKGERKRAELIRAAFEAFSVAGYRNASMVQIAEQCGVSRAGMAHHFPTKETLLTAVLEERDRINGELFFAGFDATADGLDYFARLLSVVAHNASTPGAVGLYALLSVEASDPSHPAHSYFTSRYVWLRRDIRQAFDEVAGRGLIRPGVDIDGAESDLIALIDGLQVQWLLDPGSVDIANRLRHRLDELLTVPPRRAQHTAIAHNHSSPTEQESRTL
jgi:AcrR family transcriptional regulator